ncbi:DMT family transporter (plasmid) [Phyllobacterium sp. 628]|uniref:DMT family transporter n=1 Tax=Phyllobacterium sp. 628 TaxID=2718938 RepID=UPI00166235E2|nr:DMT family transporter [Phyllobacterium sp. 628]QND54600.1 DMT family transporter [Phyllobacterium sp. 628]
MKGLSSFQVGISTAILAALCWGTATVMSKSALADVPPVSLLVLQLAGSVVVLWLVVRVQRVSSGSWQEIARYAWLGVLEPGLAYLFGLIGLTDMKAGAATLIQSSEAIMIVVVSVVILRVVPTGRFLILSVVALAGLIIALGLLNSGEAAGNGILGITLMFLATAVAAIYVVLSSRIALKTSPIVIVAWQQTVALVFALILLPAEWLLSPGGIAMPQSAKIWTLVLVSGIIQYALGFSLYMRALGCISANIAGSFLNLTPVFGLGIAFVFLDEVMTPVQLVGTAVTIIAVMAISLSGQTQH